LSFSFLAVFFFFVFKGPSRFGAVLYHSSTAPEVGNDDEQKTALLTAVDAEGDEEQEEE
jgi:hypothetical protein